MGRYLLRRLVALVPLLFLVTFIVYGLSLLIPGDAARTLAGGANAPESQVVAIRHQLGLDRPFLAQYFHWLWGALHGDLGTSLFTHTSVASQIAARVPVTLSVALGALIVTVLIGLPAGLIAGTRPGFGADRAVTVGTSIGIAIPDYFIATALVVFLAVKAHLLPAIGYVSPSRSPASWLDHLVLPSLAMGLAGAATLARQLRGSLVDVLDQDFMRTVRSKGLPRRLVLGKHALKNASIAPVTVLGIQFAYLLGGTVIIERIFSLPGLGQYYFTALTQKDVPVIQGVTLVIALTFIVMNLAVDLLYAYLNPRVRLA